MPRRHGHIRQNKPWDREMYKSRRRRKRIGCVKESIVNKRRASVKE